MAEKKLFLLDGHALVYRAHYAFINRPLINSKGLNTSAITGFTRALWDILQNEKPSHIAVAFDPPSPVFRHEMFADYKANREAQPEDITLALPYIESIVRGFNIPIVTVPNFEADDVIGTLAKQSEKEGFTVYMVTPDKDYAQLVSDKVYLYKPSRQGNGVDILGEKEVLEKWGINRVDQVIDVLALQGDSVDNIPGIPGIGAKTAVKLLAQFDSLEGLLENTDSLKGKQKEKVETFAEQGRMSKRLATIDINVPIQFDAESYALEPIDKEKLAPIFKDLEFRTLARQILGEGEAPAQRKTDSRQGNLFDQQPQQQKSAASLSAHSIADKNVSNTDHQYHLVTTQQERKKLIKLLADQEQFCFDTETTNIDPNLAEMVGMSFAVKAAEAYYVPVPEDQSEARAIIEDSNRSSKIRPSER